MVDEITRSSSKPVRPNMMLYREKARNTVNFIIVFQVRPPSPKHTFSSIFPMGINCSLVTSSAIRLGKEIYCSIIPHVRTISRPIKVGGKYRTTSKIVISLSDDTSPESLIWAVHSQEVVHVARWKVKTKKGGPWAIANLGPIRWHTDLGRPSDFTLHAAGSTKGTCSCICRSIDTGSHSGIYGRRFGINRRNASNDMSGERHDRRRRQKCVSLQFVFILKAKSESVPDTLSHWSSHTSDTESTIDDVIYQVQP
nr:hypothetical protein [Tanacetum cinerariifolium]